MKYVTKEEIKLVENIIIRALELKQITNDPYNDKLNFLKSLQFFKTGEDIKTLKIQSLMDGIKSTKASIEDNTKLVEKLENELKELEN